MPPSSAGCAAADTPRDARGRPAAGGAADLDRAQRSAAQRGTGIFYPAVERGHTVAQGTLIGRVTDFHGKVIEEIRAPFAGEILYVIGTPAISKGEPVAFVGSATAAPGAARQ